MTDEERQVTLSALIDLGFWGKDEPGDPTGDPLLALIVRERIANRIKGLLVITGGVSGGENSHLLPRKVSVIWQGIEKPLMSGKTFIEAVCFAAAALPEFLRKNPDWAADEDASDTAAISREVKTNP